MAKQEETRPDATPGNGAAGVADETAPGDVDQAESPVEGDAARAQADEFRSLLQRERADFVNYRRRVEQERVTQISLARAEALLPILPILDDLERAAADVPEELREHPWVKGVLLISGKLDAAVRTAGLERVDPLGQPFDPRLHEAFMHQSHPTIPAGHVSMVMRPGYRAGDRVIRPAQVAVSQGSADGESGEKQQS